MVRPIVDTRGVVFRMHSFSSHTVYCCTNCHQEDRGNPDLNAIGKGLYYDMKTVETRTEHGTANRSPAGGYLGHLRVTALGFASIVFTRKMWRLTRSERQFAKRSARAAIFSSAWGFEHWPKGQHGSLSGLAQERAISHVGFDPGDGDLL
jgi:hypothetical protein